MREAGAEYFEQRKLRRHARVLHLWALGVAAVISGDFFGWNYGLSSGFWGMLAALAIMTVTTAAKVRFISPPGVSESSLGLPG